MSRVWRRGRGGSAAAHGGEGNQGHVAREQLGAGDDDEAVVAGGTGRLGTIGRARLVEDVGDVFAGGVEADHELVGDLLVGAPGGEEVQDLGFAVREERTGRFTRIC